MALLLDILSLQLYLRDNTVFLLSRNQGQDFGGDECRLWRQGKL